MVRSSLALAALVASTLANSAQGWQRRSKWHPKLKSFASYIHHFVYDVDKDGGISGVLEVEVEIKYQTNQLLAQELTHNEFLEKDDQEEEGDWGEETALIPLDDDAEVHAAENQVEHGFYVVLWDDRPEHWGAIEHRWTDRMTCAERFQNATAAIRVDLDHTTKGSIRYEVREKERPRYFHMALTACLLPGVPKYLRFHMHATNPQHSIEKEFSMDRMGTLWLQLAAFLGFFILAAILSYSAVHQFGEDALKTRPLLVVLLVSILCGALGGLFYFADAVNFCINGIGFRPLAIIGAVCVCLAKVGLALLQLFVARGTDFLSDPAEVSRAFFVHFMAVVYLAVSIGAEVYSRYFQHSSRSNTLYLYASWPGFIVATLNCLLLADILRSSWDLFKRPDIQNSPVVKAFFTRTTIAAVLYFMTLPLMIIMANAMEPWNRRKYVDRAEVISRFVICAILAFVLWPSTVDDVMEQKLRKQRTDVELSDQYDFKNPGGGVALAPPRQIDG